MRVALTFDAEHPSRPHCPPNVAERLLVALDAEGVRATFFIQGRWAASYPRLARRIADDGHLVGAHSFFHASLPLLSDEGLDFDVAECERSVRAATGWSPRPWFRCPFGDGARDPRVLAALRRHGFLHVGWDVVAEDWEEDRDAAQVEDYVVAGTRAVEGDDAVILLHSWPGSTVEALPRILEGLRDLGARFVTVAQMAGRDLGATPNPALAAANPGREATG